MMMGAGDETQEKMMPRIEKSTATMASPRPHPRIFVAVRMCSRKYESSQ